MTEATGLYYSEDIVYKDITLFNEDLISSGVILYEVLRVIGGTALFLEDHIQRLQESVKLSGYNYTVSVPVLHYLLRNLIRRNKVTDGNIKIVLRFDSDHHPVIYTYLIPHAYPTPAMYCAGVETDLFIGSRSNPNVKRLLPEVRQRILEFIQAENLYDALLVEQDGTITEGSKTNVFFIRQDVLYTAPGDKVLKGVTRSKVIELCNKLNYKLIEESIFIKSLNNFEAAFFSGTSPKILPISRISNLQYTVAHPVTEAFIKAYDEMIAAYIYHW